MPKQGQIFFKAVEREKELHQATDLMGREHADHDADARRWLESCGEGYPGYQREHTRIAIVDGEVAAALRLTTDTIRIGEARLKMGGLGWVTTAPHHRRKDIGRRLIEDTFAYMRRQNYHVSMLFGIPDYYRRLGFTTTLADYSVVIDTGEAATFDMPFALRTAKPGDIPAIQKLQSQQDNGVSCTLLRTTAHMKNKWERWKEWRVACDDRGKVVAYLFTRPASNRLLVYECGVDAVGLCPAVLKAAADIAEKASLGKVAFFVPPSHPLARYLSRHRSVHEMRIDRHAGGMMRFVDIAETLESMIPEWENRLSAMRQELVRAECTLIVDGAAYRIRAHHGAVDVATQVGRNKLTLDAEELMHLVTGYGYVEDIVGAKQAVLAPDARALMMAIFPKRYPFVWPFDRF